MYIEWMDFPINQVISYSILYIAFAYILTFAYLGVIHLLSQWKGNAWVSHHRETIMDLRRSAYDMGGLFLIVVLYMFFLSSSFQLVKNCSIWYPTGTACLEKNGSMICVTDKTFYSPKITTFNISLFNISQNQSAPWTQERSTPQ